MLGHRLRDRPADAARRSGYQRDLALHVEQVHAPALFAKSHARSASGRTRSDTAFACPDEAVPSITPFLLPCKMPLSETRSVWKVCVGMFNIRWFLVLQNYKPK